MTHYYMEYQYLTDADYDAHTYFFECENDEDARAEAREFMSEGLKYIELYTCKLKGEESDEDICLYRAYCGHEFCETSYTREEAETDLKKN